MALAANGRELPEAIAVTHADSPVPAGYLERGVMMKNDANPRGTLDQVGQALSAWGRCRGQVERIPAEISVVGLA